MAAARRRLLPGLLLLVLLLPACTPEAAPAPAPPPLAESTAEPVPTDGAGPARGTLRYGLREPVAIVPGDAVAQEERLIVDALFDSLTTYDAGLSVIPAAATSWSADPEQRVWTFTLREGARFHPPPGRGDTLGPPVTAADVKFGWEVAVAEGAAGFLLELVEGYDAVATGQRDDLVGVEAPDANTLVVRLSQPLSTFPAVVAHPALSPIPRDVYLADPSAFREQPIGNGPFRAAEAWARGQFVRAQRAPDWANAPRPAQLDEILFQFADADSAYLGFQQERLQVSPLPEDAVEQAVAAFGESADGYTGSGVLRGETPRLYFLGFDVTVPPFDDPEIRRAVSLAIDRKAIIDVVGEGVAVADSLIGPGVLNGREATCEACVQDRAAARAIFAERDVQRLRLWFNRDGGHLPVARRVRDDLAAVGVVLEFQAQAGDLGDYLAELAEGGPGMFRFGWAPEHAVADELLHPLFHSGEIGRRNYHRYAREDVDALIDAARSSPGALRRVFLTRRAEDLILNRDQVIVPIMRYRHLVVVAEEVEGFRLDALGRVNLAEVSLRSTGDGAD